jgi:uncharacterized protein (DUF362 family)/ferredoxin
LSYDELKVEEAVRKSVEFLGGIKEYIKPGMKVLLKCNLLMRKRPEECVTTHPTVVQATALLVKSAGATPIIADCPGGPYLDKMLKIVYKGCGMIEAAQRSSANLNFNTDTVDVFVPEAKIAKKITIASAVKEADAIISLPKLKTHGMCLFTGAVKNMFGIIPGMTKMEYHFRMNKIDDFSDMLIDVCRFANPVLSIMDAVIGMEGNGPSAGIPRSIGAIIAGCSPYAVDVAATDLVGIDPCSVATIVKAEERGLCSASPEDIVFIGDHFKKPYILDFKLPESARRGLLSKMLDITGNSSLSKWLKPKVEPKPVIIRERCIGCGDCERCCPPKAISMNSGKPQIDMDKCIKCYCCQELCPEKAVEIGRNWAFKLFK